MAINSVLAKNKSSSFVSVRLKKMSHFFEKGDAIYFFCLQLETEARTKWHNFDNNMRLSDRAQDIERWQRELEKTLREVDAEAATLQE